MNASNVGRGLLDNDNSNADGGVSLRRWFRRREEKRHRPAAAPETKSDNPSSPAEGELTLSDAVRKAVVHLSRSPAAARRGKSGGRLNRKQQRESAHSESAAASARHFTYRRADGSNTTTLKMSEEELLSAVEEALRKEASQQRRNKPPLKAQKPLQSGRPGPGQLIRTKKWSGRPRDYRLTKKRVSAVAPDGIFLLTWANHHYLDFAMNWVGHLQLLGVTTYLIGALDDQLLQDLVEMGVGNAFAMQASLEQGDLSWGSPHFFKMGREKIQLIERVVAMGFDVIVSDVDTVWLKDPLPYMARFPEADILVSSDHLANTTNDDGLEEFPEAGSPFNIGIILFRKTALEFAKEWNQVLSKDNLYWDQNAFNDLLRRNMESIVKRPDRLFWGYDQKLWVGVLPVALFASGHTFHVQNLADKMGLQPYVVHGTFQFSGTPGKRHRFRERLIWLPDEPDYFDPPGGLLSFDLRVSHLLKPASHLKQTGELQDLHSHFDLVNGQLAQIRNALAVASSLGRTLILPRIYTGADRWWAPHSGFIPGTHGMRAPMFCPADHILDLDTMGRSWDFDSFGPDINFREYSFLENSRTPEHVVEDKLHVTICAAWESGCTSHLTEPKLGHAGLRLQNGLNDKQLQTVFQAYNTTRILHFEDMSTGVGSFESAEDFKKFQVRTRIYSSMWCCVDKHPGHVWYDMWWDQPHIDRHARNLTKWEPMTGP